MSRRLSLQLTFASERTGMSRNGLWPLFTAFSTPSASFSIFAAVFFEIASLLRDVVPVAGAVSVFFLAATALLLRRRGARARLLAGLARLDLERLLLLLHLRRR